MLNKINKLLVCLLVMFQVIPLFSCKNQVSKIITTSNNEMQTTAFETATTYSTEVVVDYPTATNDSAFIESTINAIENNAVLINDFSAICQYPELPTGCEMTALTMALNYQGVYADKCDISDNYLEKGDVGTVDFNLAFVGDPRDSNSYGCYAPVVVDTANKYLEANNSALRAMAVIGEELEYLFDYIEEEVPVIIWCTRECQPGYFSVTWNVNGQDMTWFTPEHCVVLVGYDTNTVFVADPVYGEIVSYGINEFRNSYDSLFRQAVVIK